MKKKRTTNIGQQNLIAKHAGKVCNSGGSHRDKKNDYTRKSKHKGSNSSFYFIKKCVILYVNTLVKVYDKFTT